MRSDRRQFVTEIKVMVVDDSLFMRRVISDIINGQPDMKVVATATNGKEALSLAREFRPDVITMDVEMPVMDGLLALEKIMSDTPLPVIMLSSLTQSGADATVRALHIGAVDFITKPSSSLSLDINKVAQDIIGKIRVAASARDKLRKPPSKLSGPQVPSPQLWPARVDRSPDKIVLIGTSTGGPKALHEVIPRLPGNLPAAVLVVQHMPPGFTRSLADRINGMSALRVKEAEDGEPVVAGSVYIAPGDYHLKVKRLGEGTGRRLLINLTKDPLVSGHRPSVDAMIESVVKEYWSQVLAVIMTGMGQDGTRGSAAIKNKGGRVIAEDSSTCIVFGMPRSVIDAGYADRIVPLPHIARRIVECL
jgi:two-component system chemotaxis response regulator CheB